MVCDPTPKEEVVRLALPLLSETATGELLSIVKVTVPAGVPTPVAAVLTVAIKVTLAPTTEGLAVELSAVEVLGRLTISFSVEDVLPEKLLSPL